MEPNDALFFFLTNSNQTGSRIDAVHTVHSFTIPDCTTITKPSFDKKLDIFFLISHDRPVYSYIPKHIHRWQHICCLHLKEYSQKLFRNCIITIKPL